MTLRQLYENHDGKVVDKWASYLDVYDELLAPWRERPVRVLEIGVFNGGSLELWRQFFPQAQLIVGCDINPACADLRFDDDRIRVVVGDATRPDTRREVLALSPEFDLIIDDGSHTSGDIVRAFAAYWGAVADGGLYVAEDLHCSYWREFGGGLYDPNSSMSFFRALTDLVNHEHWGVSQSRAAHLDPFARRWRCAFVEPDLARIHRIEFANSLCVLRSRTPDANQLGRRITRGEQEHSGVSAGYVGMTSAGPLRRDQTLNPRSRRFRGLAQVWAIPVAGILWLRRAARRVRARI